MFGALTVEAAIVVISIKFLEKMEDAQLELFMMMNMSFSHQKYFHRPALHCQTTVSIVWIRSGLLTLFDTLMCHGRTA